MKPKIYVVGFGPGERPYMTQQAEIGRAHV